MDGRSLGPRANAGAWLHQSLGGSTGHEPSLPLGITSRLAGIRGGPQGAVSDVCDPTERLTSLTALRHATTATLYGSQPDADSTQGVSPDMVDSIRFAVSPPTNFLRAAGRILFKGFGPRSRLRTTRRRLRLRRRRAAASSGRISGHPEPPSSGRPRTGGSASAWHEGSWAAARWRLFLVISLLII